MCLEENVYEIKKDIGELEQTNICQYLEHQEAKH